MIEIEDDPTDWDAPNNQAITDGNVIDLTNDSNSKNCPLEIINHHSTGGKPRFYIEGLHGITFWASMASLRQDTPVKLSQYIVNNDLPEEYNRQWAEDLIIKMISYQNSSSLLNCKSKKAHTQELYGVKVPKSVQQALQMDNDNGNNLWREAITKEIQALLDQKVFKFLKPGSKLKKEEGWQFAPLRMIFTVKADLRRKARLVIGGHVTDASFYETFAPTVSSENIRLLFHLVVKQRLNVLVGDINTAYLNAFTEEKVYSRAGPEFGQKEGCTLIVEKALYGLKSIAHA